MSYQDAFNKGTFYFYNVNNVDTSVKPKAIYAKKEDCETEKSSTDGKCGPANGDTICTHEAKHCNKDGNCVKEWSGDDLKEFGLPKYCSYDCAGVLNGGKKMDNCGICGG